VMCFPYMEQNAVWDRWNTDYTTPSNSEAARSFYPTIEFLSCPSNVPDTLTEPWLSYVGNAGQAMTDKVSPNQNKENVADGVFFDNSRNTQIIDNSSKDMRESNPEIRSSMNYISSNDGTSKTMMISESMATWFYAYDGNPDTPEFDVGYSKSGSGPVTDSSSTKDTPHIFGFIWKSAPQGVERINGDRNFDKSDRPTNMGQFAQQGTSYPFLYESYGYPSSNHPNGVNVAFCGGQVDFMADSVEPRVYAQLMTSNSKRSSLVIGGVQDRKLPQPSDSDY
jgi:prepilin-type processing-associated H-X9-DG protein